MPFLPSSELLPYIPGRLLVALHRDLCRMRGSRYGCPCPSAPYVMVRPMRYLLAYHGQVLLEFRNRGYRFFEKWTDPCYRGRRLPAWEAVQGVLVPEPYPEHGPAHLRASTAFLEARIAKGRFTPEDLLRWESREK